MSLITMRVMVYTQVIHATLTGKTKQNEETIGHDHIGFNKT